MATAFTLTGDWKGQINAGYETSEDVAGRYPAPAGYVWRRNKEIVSMTRNGQDVLSFTSIAGTAAVGSTLSFKSGGNTLTGNGSRTYMCEENNIVPDPVGTNIWKETQVWTYYSDWEEWALPATTA